MLIDDRVSRLIGDIYSAAVSPEAWNIVLRDIAELTRARMTSLLCFRPSLGADIVEADFGLDPSYAAVYQRHYYQHNIYSQKLRPFLRQDLVAPHEMYCSDADILRSEYYNDFQRRLGLFRVVAGVAESSPHQHFVLSVNRARRESPLDTDHLRLIQALLPHIRNARRLSRNILATAADRLTLPSPDWLAVKFGITRAEARFAHLLVSGLSLAQICRQLEVRMSTARTHLRHLYQKTGAGRQAELVARLLQC